MKMHLLTETPNPFVLLLQESAQAEGETSAPSMEPVTADGGQAETAAPGAAGEQTTPGGGGLFDSMLFPLALIALIFWFLVIGPERKNRKRREQALSALKKGDEVMTTGGMYGRIADIRGDMVILQADDKVRLRFHRSAIQVGQDTPGAKKEEPKDGERNEDAAKDGARETVGAAAD